MAAVHFREVPKCASVHTALHLCSLQQCVGKSWLDLAGWGRDAIVAFEIYPRGAFSYARNSDLLLSDIRREWHCPLRSEGTSLSPLITGG